jgi:hypothetical protein
LTKSCSTPDPAEVNVGRLDVSMHQASCVRFFEGITDLTKDMNHTRRRHRAVLSNQ